MGIENGATGRSEGFERENVSALVEEFKRRALVPETLEDEIEADLDSGLPEIALRRILLHRRSRRQGR